MLSELQPGAILISLLSLCILLLGEMPFIKHRPFLSFVASTLVVVILGIIINQALEQVYSEMALTEKHLVMIPVVQDIPSLMQQLHFPDFSQILNPEIYFAALTLALVASLETLLSVEAVDNLDPYKRVTPTNRELLAQGVGNISSGLLGGLPLTQVIVRSSINAQSGAKTKAAGIINGLLLVLAVFLIPNIINKIPLASLAAILLVVGYKLAKPEKFLSQYKSGWYHFIPFLRHRSGLGVYQYLIRYPYWPNHRPISILLENYKSAYYFKETQIGNKTIIRLSEHVSFLNRANIQQTLEALPAHSEVVIDATRSKYIDYDVYEIIQNFKNEAHHKHIKIILENVRGYGSLPPIQNARTQTYESQQSLTPDKC